mmetsp:Transcript_77875/g.232029  ORF Transcript_77875/g.232029 Transcript_77875/m.232029 type:complete len:204 (-) Transcript_77875:477-1088(-)
MPRGGRAPGSGHSRPVPSGTLPCETLQMTSAPCFFGARLHGSIRVLLGRCIHQHPHCQHHRMPSRKPRRWVVEMSLSVATGPEDFLPCRARGRRTVFRSPRGTRGQASGFGSFLFASLPLQATLVGNETLRRFIDLRRGGNRLPSSMLALRAMALTTRLSFRSRSLMTGFFLRLRCLLICSAGGAFGTVLGLSSALALGTGCC